MREVRRLARLSHVERTKDKAFATTTNITGALVTDLTVPSLSRALDKQPAADAAVALMRAALGVEMYRAAHGEYPESLPALVPECLPAMPMDPFDGKPLRYERSADGYTAHAVGLDGIDAGGTGDDIAWVRRAPTEESGDTGE